MKRTKLIFGMLILIAGIMLAFSLIGCEEDNGDGGSSLTQEQKDEAKADALEWWDEDPASFILFLGTLKTATGIDLTGKQNPNTWNDADWEKYFEACEKYYKDNGGGGDNDYPSDFPFKEEYADAAFPALTGAADFIGTWKSDTSSMHSLIFSDDGTWSLKMGMGQATATALSGRFLVSGNNIYIYEHDPGLYYLNSWGTRNGNKIAMKGGLIHAGGEAWTKEGSSGNTPTNPPLNHAIVAKWYSSQANANAGTDFVYEFTADRKLNTGTGIMGMYSFSISENTISFTVMGQTMGTATFSIDGNVLTISNSAGSAPPVANGTYYKPAS